MVKRRGLNRGLDSLLGGSAKSLQEDTAEAVSIDQAKTDNSLQNLAIDRIERGRYQPRSDFNAEALQELADSIKAQGVVQPVVVRPLSSRPGHYELIAGERRWRAAQLAELHEIPAVIRDVTDQQAMAMGLIENIQRQELNPIEEAVALKRLIDEFALTQQEAAEAVGRSRASVANLLRLLTLEPEVRTLLEENKLEMGHARALLGLLGAAQRDAAHKVVARGLSVCETESLVRKASEPAKPKVSHKLDPDTRKLQDDLSEKLGAKVQFQHSATGKGKMVIQYNSLDELEGILNHIS
ncbi:MAG: ParB/RepB/Spo0J family partition protein [Gammaproteobacteria bacterium]